jgi:hypothetical protein
MMGWRVARVILIPGIIGAATLAVSYVASPADIGDLTLISVDAARAKDIPQLTHEAPPETPVFRVRFSTRSDLVALANRLDAYAVRNQVLVGDAGCNPALKTITYARVAFMLIDFTKVYDETGAVEGRGLWASRADDGLSEYVFYFGIVPSEMPEFLSSGLQEAPICFGLTGTSHAGRRLTSNIVLVPADILAKAAARLGS